MVAAAWTVALTASAAIGLAVPRTFGLFEPEVTPRPSADHSSDGALLERPDADGTASDGTPSDVQDPDACGRPEGAGEPRIDRAQPSDRACGQGGGQRKGRPDDPGGGNGNGRGEGGPPDTPVEPGSDGNNGNGGKGDEAGDETATEDEPDTNDGGDRGNGGKGKSSGGDAASHGPSGSNDRANGPA